MWILLALLAPAGAYTVVPHTFPDQPDAADGVLRARACASDYWSTNLCLNMCLAHVGIPCLYTTPHNCWDDSAILDYCPSLELWRCGDHCTVPEDPNPSAIGFPKDLLVNITAFCAAPEDDPGLCPSPRDYRFSAAYCHSGLRPGCCTTYACSNNYCGSKGVCVEDDGGPWCVCDERHYGDRCQYTRTCAGTGNHCVGDSCVDDLDAPSGFRCECPDGWTGDDCGTEVDDCAPDPCLNNGTCVDLGSAYLCQCPTGWVGARCESKTACGAGEYADDDGACAACDPSCLLCSGPAVDACLACADPEMVVSGGLCLLGCGYGYVPSEGAACELVEQKQFYWGVGALLLAYVLVALVYGVLRWLSPRADNLAWVAFSISSIDAGTDVAFALSLLGTQFHALFHASVAIIGAALACNLAVALYLFVRASREERVRQWLEQHYFVAGAATLLSAVNVEALRLFNSGILDLRFLDAGFTDRTLERIKLASTVSILLEDLPQMVLQLYIFVVSPSIDPILVIAFVGSFVAFAFGCLSRFYLFMAVARRERGRKVPSQEDVQMRAAA